MRVEFARAEFRENQVIITETVHIGDISSKGGDLKFAKGSYISVGALQRSNGADSVSIDLRGIAEEGLFHGRHLKSIRKVALGADGGGCSQIDQRWLIVVHSGSQSEIYNRIGKKTDRSNRDLRWALN